MHLFILVKSFYTCPLRFCQCHTEDWCAAVGCLKWLTSTKPKSKPLTRERSSSSTTYLW